MLQRRASSLGTGALVLGVGAAGLLLMLWAGQDGESGVIDVFDSCWLLRPCVLVGGQVGSTPRVRPNLRPAYPRHKRTASSTSTRPRHPHPHTQTRLLPPPTTAAASSAPSPPRPPLPPPPTRPTLWPTPTPPMRRTAMVLLVGAMGMGRATGQSSCRRSRWTSAR